MSNFFGPPVSQEELQQQLADQAAQHASQPDDPLSAASDTLMIGGESLDDIIRDNSHELLRRRSVPLAFPGQIPQDGGDRRMSLMEFGMSNDPLQDFQFGNLNPAGDDSLPGTFGSIGDGIGLEDQPAGFPQSGMMSMSDPSFSNPPLDLMNNMMAFSNLNVGQVPPNPTSMGLFNPSNLPTQFRNNSLAPVDTDFAMDMTGEDGPLSALSTNPATSLDLEGNNDMMGVEQQYSTADESRTPQSQQDPRSDQGLGSFQTGASSLSGRIPGAPGFPSPPPQAVAQSLRVQPTATSSQASPAAVIPAASGPSLRDGKHKNIYSKSGFDMLRALWYVATRKNPEVQLGAVDMSCSFVVCDVTLNDCPIIYASDNFQNLTGYSRHEIIGKNCRFLQAPDGKVEAGTKREFVENSAVFNIKKKVAEGKEVQQGLINYRKGGKPFLNLITMIPIPWDTDEIRYFIGFQIDLVECPDAISGQGTGGVKVNYMHSDIGQYIWTPPPSSQWEPDNGQTLGVDDVSTLLQQYHTSGSLSDWHKQSWDNMLLENMDDVVHVLSLKGLFLYLSPSSKKVLEYDSADLIGNSLSSICHPSDIVPVTRELKDTAAGSPVNIVFRICRKQSGYTWFESRGSLFVEQGKGRKCIILVGRKRPVFTLHMRDLDANGGIGDSEIWTKLSTSGIFLFVSSNVRSLLDLLPENLEGTSIQDLMRKESRPEFGRSIEKARKGKIVSCKHEVQNKRGQVLQAQTILYPGDAVEGSNATFLLAQTKLLKAPSRAIAPAASGSGKSGVPATSGPSEELAYPSGPMDTGSGGNNTLNRSAANGATSAATGGLLSPGSQDAVLASDDNIFDELKTTRCTSWQYELRQMEKVNRLLAEELAQLLSNKKKRKRRKVSGNMVRDCANCHTRNTPEWRRGPSGNRDLCNSCGLRWAKQVSFALP